MANPSEEKFAEKIDFIAYNQRIQDLRDTEFCRIEGKVYLDHAGTTLYARSLVEAYHSDLLGNVYSNPHSHNETSQYTNDLIDSVRDRILRHLNTDAQRYCVVFTAGATASLKLLGETFTFSQEQSKKCKHHDNHYEVHDCESGCHETYSGCDERHRTANNEIHTSKGWTNRSSNRTPNCESQNTKNNEKLEKEICTSESHESNSCQSHNNCQDRVSIKSHQLKNQNPDDLSNPEVPENQLANSSTNCSGNQQPVHNSVQFSQIFAGENGCFAYLDDNHTSVLGMRELAKQKRARCICLYSKNIPPKNGRKLNNRKWTDTNNLFVFPAMSNFSGQKYPMDLGERFELGSLDEERWFTCVDGAAHLATSPLDLSQDQPDFLTMSFYKMFGFPTGIGALLVKRSSARVLQKSYFGGGTVAAQLADADYHRPRDDLSQRLEDGSLPFLDIVALHHSFTTMERMTLSFHHISLHTFRLARRVYQFLTATTFFNGSPIARVYSHRFELGSQGGIIAFNLLRQDGSYVGFAEVARLAAAHDILLRTGCFCNIGACQRWLNLPGDVIRLNHEAGGHVCGDDLDLIDGSPTGAVRVSLGYMSTLHDVTKFIDFIRHCFPANQNPRNKSASQSEAVKDNRPMNKLLEINVYPIKSCGAFKPARWRVTGRGLEYDRAWAVVSDSGVCLGQKREPRLCLVSPRIDLDNHVLQLSADGVNDVTVTLDLPISSDNVYINSKVCCDRIRAIDCGDEVADWLSEVIGRSGLRLVRYDHSQTRRCKKGQGQEHVELSLANETQYLLLASATCRQFHELVEQNPELEIDLHNLVDRFRANFLISTVVPGAEDRWRSVRMGTTELKVTGQCQRCQVICLDQSTAQKQPALWTALRDWRNGQRSTFGVQLQNATHPDDACAVSVGDDVTITL